MKILENLYNIYTVFLFAKIFNISKTLTKEMTKSINLLIKSGIDFLPTKNIKYDKTTDYIAADCIRFIRVTCWVNTDFDKLLYCIFGSEFKFKNYNSKMC